MNFRPYQHPLHFFNDDDRRNMAESLYGIMRQRRTVRQFKDEPIDLPTVYSCLQAAGTAPNGANKQPWHFSVITDRETKKQIRLAAEEQEMRFYTNGNPQMRSDVEKLGVDAHKPFLETAGCLIAIFARYWEFGDDGIEKKPNYYVKESVGIATGMLISALHQSGYSTLTHTPSPMGFLTKILDRPECEKPFLLLVVGREEADCLVPDIEKKELNDFVTLH